MIDPCAGYTKGRLAAGGCTSDEDAEEAWGHLSLPGVTGQSLVLREYDLLCLDFDPRRPGVRHEALWDLFFPGIQIPLGAAVVRTVNQGLHVWVRNEPGLEMPPLRRREGVRLDVLRYTGSGVCPNVVLPGSFVKDRQGIPVRYDLVQGGGFGDLLDGHRTLSLPQLPEEVLRFLSPQ